MLVQLPFWRENTASKHEMKKKKNVGNPEKQIKGGSGRALMRY